MFKVMQGTQQAAVDTAGLARERRKEDALELDCESRGRGTNENISGTAPRSVYGEGRCAEPVWCFGKTRT